MIKNPKMADDTQGTFEVKEIDGKTAFIFDTMPAVLFISPDGTGRRSYFFRHGEHMSDIQSLILTSDVTECVEYSLDFNAVVKPE